MRLDHLFATSCALLASASATYAEGTRLLALDGTACINAITKQEVRGQGSGRYERYEVTFENTCSRTIHISLSKKLHKYPEYIDVPAASRRTAFCTDHLSVNADCGGFVAWTESW